MDQATQHLYMNKGISEFSYSSNSSVQKQAIYKTKIVVEQAILDILSKFSSSTSISAAEKIRSICVADLGCSSGPTALLVISNLLDTIYNKYRESTMVMPEILVFLNDLPENDFNTLFKYLKSFRDELKNTKGDGFGPCFVAGMPGTFYGRLFPSNTVHFVHSSYSLHWLSQAPTGNESNKGNVYIAKSSPPSVVEAYCRQFKKDFISFLNCRSEELIKGGRMVLTFLCRKSSDPTSKEGICSLLGLLSMALKDMVLEGVVEEEKLDICNFPVYYPSLEEVKAIIQNEGSYRVNQLETFQVNWDGSDSSKGDSTTDVLKSSYVIANSIRAVYESLLTSHFGEEIINELFVRFREIVKEYAVQEKTEYTNLVISVTKGEMI
ncbi:hypothetical protein C5167_016743 [Papaver somniferum]|uniref:salicylate carboxymethyltransferase-like n=1 Tax=Papaver somniferum TaxID=3469 RepID=UPI000E6F818A|nr:salicylate carboxymethyltransferase-like [Papaver somniferum]RZC94048.1 hypothetical protein C5167_016743 [Papaver somniferum]